MYKWQSTKYRIQELPFSVVLRHNCCVCCLCQASCVYFVYLNNFYTFKNLFFFVLNFITLYLKILIYKVKNKGQKINITFSPPLLILTKCHFVGLISPMQHSFQKECIYGQGGEVENDPPISQMGTSFLVQLALIMPIINKKSYWKRAMEV